MVFVNGALAGNYPEKRQVLGITIAYFIIAAIADAGAPDVAAMFAVLLLISMALQVLPTTRKADGKIDIGLLRRLIDKTQATGV